MDNKKYLIQYNDWNFSINGDINKKYKYDKLYEIIINEIYDYNISIIIIEETHLLKPIVEIILEFLYIKKLKNKFIGMEKIEQISPDYKIIANRIKFQNDIIKCIGLIDFITCMSENKLEINIFKL